MPRYFLDSALNLASDFTRLSHCFPINEMLWVDGLLSIQLKDWIIYNLLTSQAIVKWRQATGLTVVPQVSGLKLSRQSSQIHLFLVTALIQAASGWVLALEFHLLVWSKSLENSQPTFRNLGGHNIHSWWLISSSSFGIQYFDLPRCQLFAGGGFWDLLKVDTAIFLAFHCSLVIFNNFCGWKRRAANEMLNQPHSKYSLMETIFFQLPSFIWSSKTSDWCASVAVQRLGEMLFRVDHRVSRIFPLTISAPLINAVAYEKKQLFWWPCTWNIPIAFSKMLVNVVR